MWSRARIERWELTRSSRLEVAGYDVVVGNVPFSSVKPGVNNPHRDNLHNLAVARSVEMLRPWWGRDGVDVTVRARR